MRTQIQLTLTVIVLFSIMILLGSCENELITPQNTGFESSYSFGVDTITTTQYSYTEQSYGKLFKAGDKVPNYGIIFDTLYPGIVDTKDYNMTISVYNPDSAVILTSVKANINNNSFLTIQQINDSTYSGSFNAEFNIDSLIIGRDSIIKLSGDFTAFIK